MAHFPPPLSPNNQGSSPGRESPVGGGGNGGGSSESGGGVTGSGTGGGTGGSTGGRCCETGRPLFTDPLTGQTVCSCQYDMLSYQRLPALGVYTPAPYPPEAMAAYFPALGPDQPPFYPSAAVGLDVKESLASGATWPYPSVYHPYDAAFAGYPFNGYGMDLNGARRKNATRETTSTLKAWLNEHKKNPYPTKGEKIMLAIITKMTLTQVSTWFANARRRLKKENKMTWEPRNRVDDEDNNNGDDGSDRRKDESKDNLDSKDSGTASSEDGDRGGHRLDFVEKGGGVGGGSGSGAGDTGSEWSESRPESPECLYLSNPRYGSPPPPSSTPSAAVVAAAQPPPPTPAKPRIWSLADMASKEDPGSGRKSSSNHPSTNHGHHHHHVGPPPHHHHPHHHRGLPYPPPRPHDLYRGLYGVPPPGPPDPSLLETYQRMAAAHSSSLVAAGFALTAAAAPHPPASSSTSSAGGEGKRPESRA